MIAPEASVVSVRLGNGSGRRLDGPVSREVHDELGGEIIEIAQESRRDLGVLVGIDIETIDDQEFRRLDRRGCQFRFTPCRYEPDEGRRLTSGI